MYLLENKGILPLIFVEVKGQMQTEMERFRSAGHLAGSVNSDTERSQMM